MKFKEIAVGEQFYNTTGHIFIKINCDDNDDLRANAINLYGWAPGYSFTFSSEDEVGLLRVAPCPIPMEENNERKRTSSR